LFLFGLVHGLGFAGALEEIGLPQNYLSLTAVYLDVRGPAHFHVYEHHDDHGPLHFHGRDHARSASTPSGRG